MSNTAIAATLVAYIGGFIVCLCIWYLFFRKKPFLTFDMLTDAEQDQYNTYANQIDDALLQKFIKRLPAKFAIWTIVAVATGTIFSP